MSPEAAKLSAAKLFSDGVVKLDLRTDSDFVSSAYKMCTEVFEEVKACAEKASPSGSFEVGMEHGFREIVHRAKGRYDMQHGVNGHAAFKQLEPMWEPFVTEALGGPGNWELQFNGLLMTMPGASEQLWHVDGEHLFWEQPGLQHSPPHCLNILVPLCDMSPGNGGTEFCVGSQSMTSGFDDIVWQDSAWKQRIGFEKCPVAVSAKAGEMFAFDYRTLHRAVANTTQNARPVLYWTYVRRWFKDGLNFPVRSMLRKDETVTPGMIPFTTPKSDSLPMRIRPLFPALVDASHGERVFADGAAGTQVPEFVAEKIKYHILNFNANVGGNYSTSSGALDQVTRTREAVAEFMNCDRKGVTFGLNCTNLMFHLARSFTRVLKPTDNIVLSQACHDANVAPWLLAARDSGASVRWLTVNKEDATLDVSSLDDLIDSNTKLVALGLASNATGNVHVDTYESVLAAARKNKAHVVIDGTQFVAHHKTDFHALDCDAFVCSPYKFFGPHMGLMIAKPEVLENVLRPYKVGFREDGDVLAAGLPTKADYEISGWEMGTLCYEHLAGLEGTIEYFKSISNESFTESFHMVEEHERCLSDRFLTGLKSISDVRCLGTPDVTKRTPTFALASDRNLVDALNAAGVYCTHGNHYAPNLVEGALGQKAGVTRVSLMHYNTEKEVDFILNVLNG